MNKIVNWIKRERKEVGNDYLLLLLLLFLLLTLWGFGILGDRWGVAGLTAPESLLAVYSMFAALLIASKRFSIADKQLDNIGQQFKAATRREDLERHLKGMELIEKENLASQLFGVRILRTLLETKLAKDTKDVGISLENILKENWRLGKIEGDERKMKPAARDEIIKAFCSTSSIRRRRKNILNFSSLDLRKANLWDINLSGADLSSAKLSSSILVGANLEGANLKGANLEGANLKDANLSGAELINAILNGAYLSGANLSSTDFEQVGGLDKIASYKGIWAYRGKEPKGLPDNLKEEVESNLKDPE